MTSEHSLPDLLQSKFFLDHFLQQEERSASSKVGKSVVVAGETIFISHLLYCEGEGNYTRLYASPAQNLETYLDSRSLGYWEESLQASGFARCHKSHLVNLRHVQTFRHTPNSTVTVTMTNGENIKVSRKYKAEFLRQYNAMQRERQENR